MNVRLSETRGVEWLVLAVESWTGNCKVQKIFYCKRKRSSSFSVKVMIQ